MEADPTLYFGIPRADWLSAIIGGLAIIVAFLTAAVVTPWISSLGDRHRAQSDLLRMALRSVRIPASPEWTAAIALIPIEFRGVREVQRARRRFLERATPPVPEDPSKAELYIAARSEAAHDLILRMARHLRYPDVTAELLQKEQYLAQGYVDLVENHPRSRIALEAIAHEVWRNNELLERILREGGRNPPEQRE